MKYIISFVISAVLLSSCGGNHLNGSTQTAADPHFYLFLLAGQSNMAGRGIPDSLSHITDPRILMFNKNNEWVPATDPLHFDKREAGVGPGISFAQSLLNELPDQNIRIGLIPAAVGGTSIDKWIPGAMDTATGTHPYDDALARTRTAMRKGVLKAVLWHQGSSDASPEKRVHYLDKLVSVINRLRQDLVMPELPLIAGELGRFNENKLAFNKMLHQLPEKIKRVKVVSAEGLTPMADSIHFNTSSSRLLGKRYAEAMKDLLK